MKGYARIIWRAQLHGYSYKIEKRMPKQGWYGGYVPKFRLKKRAGFKKNSYVRRRKHDRVNFNKSEL